MDWNKCILCEYDSKSFMDPSKMFNPRVCGYTLPKNNIGIFIGEGIALPKKITVELNYLRSEGRIVLTLKCKNYALQVTSSRLRCEKCD